ncbi:hypothetical protein IE53DRAFT_236026 [Violaceomyces palustris]|uniref:Uncharacterized protein n=1 Tax=Violaceomyces palustris TaxID=1673888 RepID=A0ACD0NPK1_9BASI|nr:hypothetical protein IE53DRAFT_236026 [Violaceomyces palustris]
MRNHKTKKKGRRKKKTKSETNQSTNLSGSKRLTPTSLGPPPPPTFTFYRIRPPKKHSHKVPQCREHGCSRSNWLKLSIDQRRFPLPYPFTLPLSHLLPTLRPSSAYKTPSPCAVLDRPTPSDRYAFYFLHTSHLFRPGKVRFIATKRRSEELVNRGSGRVITASFPQESQPESRRQ